MNAKNRGLITVAVIAGSATVVAACIGILPNFFSSAEQRAGSDGVVHANDDSTAQQQSGGGQMQSGDGMQQGSGFQQKTGDGGTIHNHFQRQDMSCLANFGQSSWLN